MARADDTRNDTRGARGGLPFDLVRHTVRGARAIDLSRAGRHAAAERLLRDVTGALLRRNAPAPAAEALVSLGRITLERGRASQAEALFAEAAGLAEMAGDRSLTAGSRIWQASASTDAGHLTTAETLCREVRRAGALGGADTPRAEAALARVLLWQGRITEASSCELDREGGDPDTDAYAVSTHVRVLLAAGDVFQAGRRAGELRVLAEKASSVLVTVLALAAQVRMRLATGDLVEGAVCLGQLRQAARAAHMPLRWTRLRLAWVDALTRAGRTREAAQELGALARVRAAVPALLREAIDGRIRQEAIGVVSANGVPRDVHADVLSIVSLGACERDDHDAVRLVLERTATASGAARVELFTLEQQEAVSLLHLGAGPETQLAPRVFDRGVAVEDDEGAGQGLGVPVRLEAAIVAALVASWPAGRARPDSALALLEVAAAALGSRVGALRRCLAPEDHESHVMPELVGASAPMAAVRRAVLRAAQAPFATLIEGESGSGKELVARALHRLSARGKRRFCDVNCAALPDDLLESELFGHARGAFTGAVTDRAGLVEEAHGGTLFLDEVVDLSLRAQAKLLRVLQQQEVRRVGETLSRKVDVRVVSAANRSLRDRVAEGCFREDLFYRLDVIRVHVPALRERREDIPLLARHFWRVAAASVGTSARLTSNTVRALVEHDWPGNVRELQNVIAGLAVVAPSHGQVPPSLLPPALNGTRSEGVRLAAARNQLERRMITAALDRAGGRRAQAARDLGLSRQGLLKMMARLGLGGPPERQDR